MNFTVFYQQFRHLCLEVYLAAGCQNLFPHILYYAGQLVSSDVWVGVGENAGARPELAEDIQYLLYVAAFL